mmetsp:Transcript_9983/g.20012  ORF Transcript_9983/g.20012 Transcript_9983/m.20012 type:complete len:133 (-) Transcript_9983:233-631(-)
MAASATTGRKMLDMPRWAVVGDALNPKKPAFAIAEKLREAGKEVHVVNPREKEGRCFTSLIATKDEAGESGAPIDVVDLVISPQLGPGIIDEMAALSIANVFIQPGAASEEILQRCAIHGISVHQGCVLVEL